MTFDLSRRQFLAASSSLLLPAAASAKPEGRLKVAAVYTVMRYRSHAFNILESFVRPYLFNGKVLESGVDVVSLYADQRAPENDLTDEVSRRFKIPLFKSIEDALTLGGKNLAVDAVLSIGEHGEYRVNDLGQTEYPRKRFFDEIVAVMRRSNRFVPLFNDKHLSYRWDWAKEMYDNARKHRMPFMAGSSVPLTERRPPWDLPAGAVMEEAVSVHGGGLEVYDFHGFEVLQSFAESRKGGETGITRVEFLTADALEQAMQKGRISRALVNAALATEFGKNLPNLLKPVGGEKPDANHALLLTYKDGFKATILKVGRESKRWLFSCKLAGDKNLHALRYYVGPWGNRNLFMGLSNAILSFFKTGQAPYPVERTLLASGVCDFALHSRAQGKPLATPQLEIAYAPRDFGQFRERGASWKILEKVAETKFLDPAGRSAK